MRMDRRVFCSLAGSSLLAQNRALAKPRNIVFILTDDHRYDALGFLKGQSWLQTPHLDRMAAQGVHFKNAFVTTALCSPSRATILTGKYAHQHGIVDNNTPIPPGTRYFSQDLQKAGYKTAFIGKWHMGSEGDDPQPGFDRWVSFRGQGTYLPSKNGLNVDGTRVAQKGYITDELTDYAASFIDAQRKDQPWFLYLSHKATHSEFIPAQRHQGKFKDQKFVPPSTMDPSDSAHKGRPMWVKNQRNSWHGVDYPYHSRLSMQEYYQRYAETLCAVDDSVGRVTQLLQDRGQLDQTLIIYMGDNGFAFGEHGLIDKRTAYEESMRVPLLMRCPELFGGGRTLNQMAANLDIKPTIFEAAGIAPDSNAQGSSLLPLASAKSSVGRKEFLYEYYWEKNFPQTPTVHALREEKFKYIRVQGVWDVDELYDLENDPQEANNLIDSAEHKPIVQRMSKRLFEILKETQGLSIPLYPDRGGQSNKRSKDGAGAAPFPSGWIK
jgi:N-acetylglucosamine-6-sulfatase